VTGEDMTGATGPFGWVDADRWGACRGPGFRLREDFAVDLASIVAEVRAAGAVITSSGGLRPLDAEVSPGRSPVSLHYLGRAIDLCIWSGMQRGDDRYVVIPDPTMAGDRPFWRVFCVLSGGMGSSRAIEARLWRPGDDCLTVARTAILFDLTERFEAGGWSRVPARPGWQEHYLSVEWWHLERRNGLEAGQSTFAGELCALYPAAAIAASPLAALGDRVWNGRWFANP
jgi:hypothetical protein